MGWRFRKRIRLLPGVRWNLSKKSSSITAGVPGYHKNFSRRGVRTTYSLPGTGVSYSTNDSVKLHSNASESGSPRSKGSGCGCGTILGLILVGVLLFSRCPGPTESSTAAVRGGPASPVEVRRALPVIPAPVVVRRALPVPVKRAKLVRRKSPSLGRSLGISSRYPDNF
jgi:hypothetical protein